MNQRYRRSNRVSFSNHIINTRYLNLPQSRLPLENLRAVLSSHKHTRMGTLVFPLKRIQPNALKAFATSEFSLSPQYIGSQLINKPIKKNKYTNRSARIKRCSILVKEQDISAYYIIKKVYEAKCKVRSQ